MSKKLTQKPVWYPKKLPHKPGIYWFSDGKGQVLYVGKAKDIQKRVQSYTNYTKLNTKTQTMVDKAEKLQFQVLASELEALLVEAELIRLHQPPYNILLKDDKTPLYIAITSDDFPKVITLRKKDIVRKRSFHNVNKRNIFGPYQSSHKVKEVLKIIRPIFLWCNNPHNNTKRPCFYYHLQQCSGACVGKVSKSEYRSSLQQLKQFLQGKTSRVLSSFRKKMKQASSDQKYEQAAQYRDKIQLIEKVLHPTFRLKPDMKLPKLQSSLRQESLTHLYKIIRQSGLMTVSNQLTRIEGYDVSNIMGKHAAVSMVVFIDGQPETSQYRLFNIRTLDTPNDYHMMKEAIQRRQKHKEWGVPSLLVIDGGKGQLRAALSVWKWSVPIVSVVKNPDRLVIPLFQDPENRSIKNLQYNIVNLRKDHPTLHILQHVRDESHRFAKKQHERLSIKALIY